MKEFKKYNRTDAALLQVKLVNLIKNDEVLKKEEFEFMLSTYSNYFKTPRRTLFFKGNLTLEISLLERLLLIAKDNGVNLTINAIPENKEDAEVGFMINIYLK